MKYAKRSQAFFLAGSILVGCMAYAFCSGCHKSTVNQRAGLQGEAACERLKQDHLYDSLQAAVSTARYRIYADEKTENAFYANNSAQHLTAYFTPDAATLTVKHGANSNGLTSEVTERATSQARAQSEQSQFRLKFIGAGYGDVIYRPQGEPAIIAAENRVTYTHRLTTNHDSTSRWLSIFAKSAIRNPQPAIEEWFVNKLEGVEQGFTINQPVGERTPAICNRKRRAMARLSRSTARTARWS